MPMRLLLATDDVPLATAMRQSAQDAGYEAAEATDAAALREELAAGDAGMLVVDEAMALDDATRAAVERAHRAGTRILLTKPFRAHASGDAGDGTDDSDSSADGGVPHDDTLTMPFSDAEFLAHLHVLERGCADDDDCSLLIRGDLRVDRRRRQAFYGNTNVPLPLSPREYEALEVLAEANGRFMSFDEILRAVRADGFFDQRDIMAHALYSLDRKLRHAGFLLTQRGDRYRIW